MGAGHNHGPTDPASSDSSLRVRLAIAFALTGIIVVAQLVGSVITGSLALLTDTAHAATDAIGLAVALVAATVMHRPVNKTRTWGLRRIEVIAALGQASLLLAVGLYAAVEGVRRLFAPPEVPSTELLIFGIIGLVANIVAMLVLASGRGANFNMRAAFLEVLNDALGSLGVIVAAIVIATTGFQQADALAGLFIAALIAPRALKLMAETTRVLMEFTPKGIDLDDVRAHILEMDRVHDVHDLHASTVATGLPIISAHIVVDDDCFQDGHAPTILDDIRTCVATHFAISFEHSTFQLETSAQRHHEEALATHHP